MAETWRQFSQRLSEPAAGLLYVAAWLGGAYAVAAAARWLERRATPGALRLRYWSGWAFLGRLVTTGASLAWLFALLRAGVLVTSDVGLGHVAPLALWRDSQLVGRWLSLTAACGALVLLLWLGYWQTALRGSLDIEKGLPPLSYIVEALGHQAALAILRAAVIPLVGVYWGIWVGAVAKLLMMLAHPRVRRRLARGDRALVYLEWALDWQSAALLTRSVVVRPHPPEPTGKRGQVAEVSAFEDYAAGRITLDEAERRLRAANRSGWRHKVTLAGLGMFGGGIAATVLGTVWYALQ